MSDDPAKVAPEWLRRVGELAEVIWTAGEAEGRALKSGVFFPVLVAQELRPWVTVARTVGVEEPAVRMELDRALTVLEKFCDRPADESPQTLSGALSDARGALAKEAASTVAPQRTEESSRLALLYVLYRADRRKKGSGYFQGDSGLAELLGVEQLRLNTWVEYLNAQSLLVPARGAFGGVEHRPIYISQAGIDFVERTTTSATQAAPVREKAEKFRILDTQGLLKNDLAAPEGIFGTALLYVDVDHFKSLNNKHTETVIDRTLLRELQRLMVAIVSEHGFAYAEGGDEMIVLLKNSSVLMATTFAEALREKIASTPFAVGEAEERLTVSVGIAWAPAGSAASADLQAEANVQKHLAKETFGRNCVVYAKACVTPR